MKDINLTFILYFIIALIAGFLVREEYGIFEGLISYCTIMILYFLLDISIKCSHLNGETKFSEAVADIENGLKKEYGDE